MSPKVRIQLSIMMFLQFFIWGSWFATIAVYLFKIGFAGGDVGSVYSTVNWGAIIAPFFIAMIADRYFAAEKVLGICHLLGAIVLYAASRVTAAGPFFWMLLGYALLYMPTLALVNAVSFNQMSEPGRQFPKVRVLGTIGWIVAGWVVSLFGLEPTATPLVIAAGVSLALGLYSFTLPATPPKSPGKKVRLADVLGLDALALLKDRSFAVLVGSSLLVCIPLSFYFAATGGFLSEVGVQNIGFKMTLGQMSEIGFMLLMPFFLARLGVKKLMLLGMLAWVVRYIAFAAGAGGSVTAALYLGIVLHGICFDFFFVTGQIYVDRKAPAALQASAQGFIAFATYGVGMLIGSKAAGWAMDAYRVTDATGKVTHNWGQLWYVPAGLAAAVMVIFALAFKSEPVQAAAAAPAGSQTGSSVAPTAG